MKILFESTFRKTKNLVDDINRRGSPMKRDYFVDEMNDRYGLAATPDIDLKNAGSLGYCIIKSNFRILGENIGTRTIVGLVAFMIFRGLPVVLLNYKPIRLLLEIGGICAGCIALLQIIQRL